MSFLPYPLIPEKLMAEFPTFALLMAAETLIPRPCSDLRLKQLDDARVAVRQLGDLLVDDEANGEHCELAMKQYTETVAPFLTVANPDSTAAARALSNVLDFSIRHKSSELAPGGVGTSPEDYLPHLLYALAALDCAMDRAIRSQPEPTIAA